MIAASANAEPSAINFGIAFFFGGKLFDMLVYVFFDVLSTTLKKKTSFAFVFHYLIMNLTILHGGRVAMNPSNKSEKSVNSAIFTAFLFSNEL